MPMYDYKCTNCDAQFEKIMKIDDRDIPLSEPCPRCSEITVTRSIATPAISYSHTGSMKTTDSFNDRLKEIKRKVPERFKANLNNNIR